MRHQAAVDWLLDSDEPGIRLLARRDVLGERVEEDPDTLLAGPKVRALLSGQQADGGFEVERVIRRYRGASRSPDDQVGTEVVRTGGHWTSAQWRLVSLVDLGVPPGEPQAMAAAEHSLSRILGRPEHRGRPTVIDGLHRVCTSKEGAALAFCSRLGMAADPRVQGLAAALLAWQWPDGGWNCHRNASGRRSSFHETVVAAWGLHEYARATGDHAAADAADRTAELFLQHRLFYSLGSGRPSQRHKRPPAAGEVINARWLKLGYPSYWHYDVMTVLMLLARMGKLDDPRARDGLDALERSQRADGLWAADRQWWTPPESRFEGQHEVVDWGRAHEPSQMITLNALRVLRASGRLPGAEDG